MLESSHPPEATVSHDPRCHEDVTDSPTFNCGWRVLPEAPATSEGAGFYLQLCCQCVLPSASTTSGAASHVVITCVEYSSKFGMLVCYHQCVYVCVCGWVCVRVCILCIHTYTYTVHTRTRMHTHMRMWRAHIRTSTHTHSHTSVSRSC